MDKVICVNEGSFMRKRYSVVDFFLNIVFPSFWQCYNQKDFFVLLSFYFKVFLLPEVSSHLQLSTTSVYKENDLITEGFLRVWTL